MAKKPLLLGTERLTAAELTKALAYVRARVVSFDLVDAIRFDRADKITLDLASGVQRTLSWPG